jgi:hypothetical protein
VLDEKFGDGGVGLDVIVAVDEAVPLVVEDEV